MTTEATPNEQDEPQAPTGEGPAELREAYNREKARNKALTDEVMGIRLGEIGLDPTVGLGKAIAKEYDGELSVEAIAQFAKDEYAYEGQTTQSPQVVGQARIDEVAATGTPVTPNLPTDDPQMEALQKAASAGDIRASLALKTMQL